MEDELSKKRAELRELLRQESSSSSSIAAPPPIPPSSPGMSSSGGGKIHITPGISSSQSGRNSLPHHPVPGTSLPPGPPSGEIMHRGSMMDLITESAEFRHRRERSSTLPKVSKLFYFTLYRAIRYMYLVVVTSGSWLAGKTKFQLLLNRWS